MERVKAIAEDIRKKGGKAFIIGGFVRDLILERESKDIDVEVYGISPDVLESILKAHGNVKYVGQSFGVFKLNDAFDFSMPRKERKNGVGHKGFDITVDPFMTIEEATMRRDLTMNSLLFDPLTGDVIDLFNGVSDIKNGVIRHINDATFAEDPLRVLRVAQFKARFIFDVHDNTIELCKSLVPEMKELSRERFFIEFEKILMKAEKPSIAFEFMRDIGLLESLFPELAVLSTIEQGEKHHPEGNVFNHTMLAIDSIPREQRRLDIMFAVLTHDMGKALVESQTEENGKVVHFFGHAEESETAIREFMSHVTNEADLIETVVTLAKYHMRPYDLKKRLSKPVLRRLALKVNIRDLMTIHEADLRGRTVEKDMEHISTILALFDEIENEIKPIIKGRDLIDLGLEPSRFFGVILKEIFEMQLDGVFNTFEDGLNITKSLLIEKGLLKGDA
jgi:tRNA nucleotidyltransferase (CCA-adding enzyme)